MKWFTSWGYLISGTAYFLAAAYFLTFEEEPPPPTLYARMGIASLVAVWLILKGWGNIRRIKAAESKIGGDDND